MAGLLDAYTEHPGSYGAGAPPPQLPPWMPPSEYDRNPAYPRMDYADREYIMRILSNGADPAQSWGDYNKGLLKNFATQALFDAPAAVRSAGGGLMGAKPLAGSSDAAIAHAAALDQMVAKHLGQKALPPLPSISEPGLAAARPTIGAPREVSTHNRVAYDNSGGGDPAPAYKIAPEQRTKMEALGYDPDFRLFRGGERPFSGVTAGFKKPGEEGYTGHQNYTFKYFSSEPRIANKYSANAYPEKGRGPLTTPVVAKKDNAIAIDFGGREYSSVLSKKELPAELHDALPIKMTGRYGMEDIAKAAREKGYDMAVFNNMSDMGGMQSQFLPLKANTLRSPWAKFDPANAASGDIMAGLAPFGAVGLGALYGPREPAY